MKVESGGPEARLNRKPQNRLVNTILEARGSSPYLCIEQHLVLCRIELS